MQVLLVTAQNKTIPPYYENHDMEVFKTDNMIKIMLTFLVIPFIYIAIKKDKTDLDYIKYHRAKNHANYLIHIGDTTTAIQIYDSLINCGYTNFPIDYQYIAELAYLKGDEEKAFEYWETSLTNGYQPTWAYSQIDTTMFSKEQQTKINSYENRFKINSDKEYISILDSLAKLDQAIRYEYLGKKMSDELINAKLKAVDTVNVIYLYNLIQEKGFPTYKKVGHKYVGAAYFIILHAMRYYDCNDELFVYFRKRLKEEISKGNYPPASYANWLDQYYSKTKNEKQLFGSYANMEGVLYPIIAIEAINKNRFDIGLNPLDEYLKTSYYRKP